VGEAVLGITGAGVGGGGACIGAEAVGVGWVDGGGGTGAVIGAVTCGTSTGAAGGEVEAAV